MSHPAESVEVLVIGGGVIGSSIAYHVAQQGRTEVAVSPAASWAGAGGMRLWEQDPAEATLARAAIERWPSLAEELEAELEYRKYGHLLLAENEVEAEHLQSFVQRQHELGFADVFFLDRKAVFSLVPGLGEQVTAGSFSAASGQADPRLTTRAFATAAKRQGASYWTSTECLALQRVADRVIGAQTGRGLVQAEQTVLAAGAWPGPWASSCR
jgi:sarcosine oxidase subunit beta